MLTKNKWRDRLEKSESLDSKTGLEIAMKKDSLWIRWVYGKYLINKNLWHYTIVHDVYWYWTKLCLVKEEFK